MLDTINREYLSKTETSTYQTNHHRYNRSPAHWKSTTSIPFIDIVPPTTEHKVFDDENNGIGTQPVSNEKHEAVQRIIKVAPTGNKSNRKRDIHHCSDERPDVARDPHEGLAEHLHRKAQA